MYMTKKELNRRIRYFEEKIGMSHEQAVAMAMFKSGDVMFAIPDSFK